MKYCILLILSIAYFSCMYAEDDLPLGVLKLSDDKDYITAEFNAPHEVLADDMVGIYGPGKVVKHPLTNQVETEYRKLVAKAHVVSASPKTLRAKVVFLAEGVTLENGFDVVPMPGEASPDAPPIIDGEIEDLTVDAQQTVAIKLPIIDPESKGLGITWSLKGDAGNLGFLSAQTSGLPEVDWTAPGFPSSGKIVATVVDPLGQSVTAEVPFTVGAVNENYRKRKLKPFAQFGGTSGIAYKSMVQAHNGHYWAISADGRSIFQVNPGWTYPQLLEVASEANLRQPVALFPFNRELYVLDGSAKAVLVIAAGGQLQRQFSGLKSPSDLAVDSDGTVYVADQGAGGVQVFEKNGAFRATLGRAGTNPAAFQGLSKVCLDKDGICYALDASKRMIVRFNKQHRRLDSWSIQGDPQIKLLDIAAHKLGLLILQSNGQVLIHTERGLSGNALPSPVDSGLVDRITEPNSLVVDRTGRVYASYPKEKLMVRYDEKGALTGVRGPGLWSYDQVVADARGWKYGMLKRTAHIYAHDSEGWRRYRLGGMLSSKEGPFERPGKMAVAFNGSALVVADERRMAIERFDLKDMGKSKITFGQKGKNNGQFQAVTTLCMDDTGFTYVADATNHRVSVFNQEGNFLYNFGTYERGRTAGEIVRPQFICVNAEGTICYIYDSKKYEIQKFELNLEEGMATHITNAGGRGKAMGQVAKPVGLACDRFGLLYLLDSGRRDLQVLDFRGNNAVGIVAVNMSDYKLSSVDNLALNPDGLPSVGARGQFLSLRWEKQ